jgi:hypothetical protein
MPVHASTSCHPLWAFVLPQGEKSSKKNISNTKRGLTHLSKGRRLAPKGGISMKGLVKNSEKHFVLCG